MNILVIGSGGREHVLCWKIAQSPLVSKLYCAPGNAGISAIAETIDIKPNSLKELASFALEMDIDLTVVGPEQPLALGIVDEFHKKGLRIFGPLKKAAKLESSKVFAKEFMKKRGIPTASFQTFDSWKLAHSYLIKGPLRCPLVVKADGLAAGKGAIVCQTLDQAEEALSMMMVDKKLGEAGEKIVIEEGLKGKEVSFLVLADGRNFIPLATAQDYKRALDNDEGANTGGMGSYSPSAYIDDALERRIIQEIVQPTLAGMAEEGCEFRGILYVGIMLTEDGPKVLEFNVRFGDPETQVILPRMESDLLPLLEGGSIGALPKTEIKWNRKASVCVIATSGGYPGPYEKGKTIRGLNRIQEDDDLQVFHAGTIHDPTKGIMTWGGRVLGVNALGRDIQEARKNAYKALGKINFEGMHYRKDIAFDACSDL